MISTSNIHPQTPSPKLVSSKQTFIQIIFGVDKEAFEEEVNYYLLQLPRDFCYPPTFDELIILPKPTLEVIKTETYVDSESRFFKFEFAMKVEGADRGLILRKHDHSKLRLATATALHRWLNEHSTWSTYDHSVSVENKLAMHSVKEIPRFCSGLIF